MKKIHALILVLLLTPLIAGLYGILHDQLTYSISPEYYTKFKFYQFGLAYTGKEAIFPHPRLQVCLVGFMATWWTGLLIGLVLGFTAWGVDNGRRMWQITLHALLITLVITFITGLIGLAYGKLWLVQAGVNWWLPENLMDRAGFIAVGSMHNFSYSGGALGLIAAVIYIQVKKQQDAA